MSHDQTKDLTFNQKYAGRSRSRRDLNTIKTDAVVAIPFNPSSDGYTQTWYDSPETFGGAGHMRVATTYLNGEGPFLQGGSSLSLIGVDMQQPTEQVAWSALTDTDASICIWRGPRDGATGFVNASRMKGVHSNGRIRVHGVEAYQIYRFGVAGGGAPADIQMEIGVGGNSGTLQPNNAAATEDGFLVSTGGTVVNIMNAANDSKLFPGASGHTVTVAVQSAQRGTFYKDGIIPTWIDNKSSGPTGGVGSKGVCLLGATVTGLDNASDFYSGVYVHLQANTGTLSQIIYGVLMFNIYYTHEPYVVST